MRMVSSPPYTRQGEPLKKRFTDEQIIGILREAEFGTMQIKALCKKHNLTEQIFPLAKQVLRP